jgi:hypothetical protein
MNGGGRGQRARRRRECEKSSLQSAGSRDSERLSLQLSILGDGRRLGTTRKSATDTDTPRAAVRVTGPFLVTRDWAQAYAHRNPPDQVRPGMRSPCPVAMTLKKLFSSRRVIDHVEAVSCSN